MLAYRTVPRTRKRNQRCSDWARRLQPWTRGVWGYFPIEFGLPAFNPLRDLDVERTC